MRSKVFFKAVKKIFQTVKLFRVQNLTRCGDYLPRTDRTNFLFSLLAVEQCNFQHPIIISSRVYKKMLRKFLVFRKFIVQRKRRKETISHSWGFFRMKLGVLENVGSLIMTEIRHSIFVQNKRNAARHDCHEVKSWLEHEMICKIWRKWRKSLKFSTSR